MTKKNTRYITSNGLAFSEEKEMRKLARLAAEGWLLESFAFLGYRLRRGEPQELVYSLDMQRVDPGDWQEYREVFEAGGWRHVCSAGEEMHVFAAPPGTPPIFSDRSTRREKYERMSRITGWSAMISLPVLLAGLAVGWAGESSLSSAVGLVIIGLGAIVGVPNLMMFVAYRSRIGRLS